jgi:hypothetical protein
LRGADAWYKRSITDDRKGIERKGETMTERRAGSGGTEDNVRDELDEATRRGNPEDSEEAGEEEERTGGTGGVKDNVSDEWDDSQRR